MTVAAAGVFGLSVTGLLGSASLPLALGSVAIGGLGVVKLATAARHFLRFGYRSTVTILGSVGVLGAVVAAWPVLMALDLMGVWQIPAALREVYPIVLVGAGLVALFLTLRAVLAWVLEPPGRTPIDDDVEPMEDARER